MNKYFSLLLLILLSAGLACKKETIPPKLTFDGTWKATFTYYYNGQADDPMIWSSDLTINSDGTAQANHKYGNPISDNNVDEYYSWAKVDDQSIYLRSKNWSVTNNTMIYVVKEYSREHIILEGFDDNSQFWHLVLRKPSNAPKPTYADCNAVNYFNSNDYEFALIDSSNTYSAKINTKREILGMRFNDDGYWFHLVDENLHKKTLPIPPYLVSAAYEYYTPKCINNKSEIVGEHSVNGVYHRSFLYRSGTAFTIQYPDNTLRITEAMVINDDGLIAGGHDQYGGYYKYLFFLKNNQYTSKRFPVSEATYFHLADINNTNIIGYYTSSHKTYPFIMNLDGTLAVQNFDAAINNELYLEGLNNMGQKVGSFKAEVSCSGSPYKKTLQHGLLINANGDYKIIDIPEASGTRLLDINDKGDIVGTVTKLVNNKSKSFTFILRSKK